MPEKFHAIVLKHRRRIVGRRHQRGATAVEYALMVGFIAAVIAGVVATLGGKVNDLFSPVPGWF